MKIRILAVGRLKEKYLLAMEEEYLKRLSGYCNVVIEEINDLPTPENASPKLNEEIKSKEDSKILAKLKPTDFVVLLDLGGKELTSTELSSELDSWFTRGGANLTFVIGGSLGLSQEMKGRGNAVLTLSRLTFTHQMSRLILLEQLYRSFRILHHEPYDK